MSFPTLVASPTIGILAHSAAMPQRHDIAAVPPSAPTAEPASLPAAAVRCGQSGRHRYARSVARAAPSRRATEIGNAPGVASIFRAQTVGSHTKKMSARPLSPHLSVYRFMYTMALSILHRITGLLLSLGLLVLIYWLMSASLGELSYGSAVTVLSAPLFRVLLLGWLAAYAYHFCNGIRHLFWDAASALRSIRRAPAAGS